MQINIPFDNSFVRLPDKFYARLDPTPVSNPGLIVLNDALANQLGLDAAQLRTPDGIAMLAGNEVASGSQPLAMAYAGQQFGNWSPQLGDGRALLLGEVLSPDGTRFDIQLKGSGPTPFSRMGDGRAWLGPVLREYIVSEAMAALGIKTTRALAAVTTGDAIFREELLPGAILARVARAHIRVGSFQYFAIRKDEEGLKQLADYTIDRLYPQCREQDQPYAAFFESVVEAQIDLVSRWMGVGFIHGVMNTDNVSIAGETIDYGPCAFMDDFHPQRVFSSIDEMGRYAYENQPPIAHWNLVQFAQALLPLLGDTQEAAVAVAQAIVDSFQARYEAAFMNVFGGKIGIPDDQVSNEDKSLINDLLKAMADQGADFTNTFRTLSEAEPEPIVSALGNTEMAGQWFTRWQKRVGKLHETAHARETFMKSKNPAFVPRNHRVEQVIRAAREGDYAPFEELNAVLANPFIDQPGRAAYRDPPSVNEQVRHTFCGT